MRNPGKVMRFLGISLIVVVLTKAFVLRINSIDVHGSVNLPTAGAAPAEDGAAPAEDGAAPAEDGAAPENEEVSEVEDTTVDEEKNPPSVPTGENFINTNSIYSFLQGPKAWQKKYNWSGYWGELYTDEGDYFGSFGCGLCCIANIYDTLSPYEAAPTEVYHYAMDNSSYYPTSENSAISWDAMHSTLNQLGMDITLTTKPGSYEAFRSEIENSKTAVILVQSNNPDSYWGETAGHYVTIWDYNPYNETVFVTNSAANSKNRKTIPLTECYDYLKVASQYQVLYVRSYDEASDTWKHQAIETKDWIRPDYLKAKS